MTTEIRYWVSPTKVAPVHQYRQECRRRYELAMTFVQQMDRHLTDGTRHVRDCDGALIPSLDQLLVAIDEGRWPA